MKKLFFLLALLMVIIACSEKQEYTPALNKTILKDIDELEKLVEDFRKAGEKPDTKTLHEHFVENRLQYKKIEWAIEYFIPEPARFMNGPALDELELEENREFPPHGFQVIEELIYPEFDPANKKELQQELTILLSNTRQALKHVEAITISPDYAMDALRLQIYRVIALGITGFDSPIAQMSVSEVKGSLQGIPQLLEQLKRKDNSYIIDKADTLINEAIAYCTRNDNFNTFNRAEFISQYLNPLSKHLHDFQKEQEIEYVQRGSALRPEADHLFAVNTFDVDAFIPSPEYKYSKAKAELGKLLFYDTSLSKDNNRSCASCHNPDKGFTDGLKTNLSLKGSNLRRNTPTVTYASLQHGQFWDLRQPDLEKQSVDVIQNKDEMHGSMDIILSKITADTKYPGIFKKAFNSDKVEAWQVQNAIASYIRSLNAFNSRFDKYMRGNKKMLSAEEINGMNIFMGKGKCATCHFTPIFNGTVPPLYQKTEHEVIGTPKDKAGTQLSDDSGRYLYNKMPQLKNAYKTPGLRNVAVTAPYMHNGVYTTLDEVVDFYNKGGGAGIGLTVDNQTLPFDKLNLTPQEMKALVAFMKTLTDEQYEK